jgi:acyl-CoA dehydrogenase
MTPWAHMLWGSVWAGIAAESVERSRLFLRKQVRAGADRPLPGEVRLARARLTFNTLRTLISAAKARYEEIADQPKALEAVDYQSAVSLLKVQVSELAVATVMSALQACGIAGYRNDSAVSQARLLRDVLSAPLMINNDRILTDLQSAALLERADLSL